MRLAAGLPMCGFQSSELSRDPAASFRIVVMTLAGVSVDHKVQDLIDWPSISIRWPQDAWCRVLMGSL